MISIHRGLLVCVGAVSFTMDAQATTCASSTPSERVESADMVFLGTLTSIEDRTNFSCETAEGDLLLRATFAVETRWKGDVSQAQFVVVQVGNFDWSYQVGERYYILTKPDTALDGAQRTDICIGSTPETGNPDYYGVLGDGSAPLAGENPSEASCLPPNVPVTHDAGMDADAGTDASTGDAGSQELGDGGPDDAGSIVADAGAAVANDSGLEDEGNDSGVDEDHAPGDAGNAVPEPPGCSAQASSLTIPSSSLIILAFALLAALPRRKSCG